MEKLAAEAEQRLREEQEVKELRKGLHFKVGCNIRTVRSLLVGAIRCQGYESIWFFAAAGSPHASLQDRLCRSPAAAAAVDGSCLSETSHRSPRCVSSTASFSLKKMYSSKFCVPFHFDACMMHLPQDFRCKREG